MLPAQLNDAVIALLQQEGKVFLGWEYGIPVASAPGYTAGQLYRVVDYDERGHVLHLKPEGKAASEAHHRVTFDKYGSMFTAMGVKRIEMTSPYKQVTLATGYSQPISPGYRNRRPAYSPPPPPPRWSEQPPIEPPKPRSDRFTETLNFDMREAEFDEGTISFTVKVKSIFKQEVQVTIQNPAVRKYFDAIKNYIWKLFGSKKTACTITFNRVDGKWIAVSVDSCELLHLDGSILQQIHDLWVQEVLLSGDREDILPLDDLVEPVKDETTTTDTIWAELVQEAKTKHYHHIEFLSARQDIDLQKLSITGKPVSFVFVIREAGSIFLIWETYSTEEATYIWKITGPEEIRDKFALIEGMRKGKRMLYRNKKEKGFSFIDHEYQLPMKGFHKWKEKLEDIIQLKHSPADNAQ